VTEAFDFIIVGAGSAGCALANRLSADPGTRVALLEAGGNDNNMLIQMPAGIAQIIPPEKASPYDWGFWTEPQAHLGNRPLYWPRGRALGGSSSINGMVYIRGHASDYDRWSQLGLTGWGWADVLPYFRKAEDSERGSDEFHGSGGPLHTSRKGALPNPLNAAFAESAVQAGYKRTDDFNGPQFEGVGQYDATIKDGERFSAAKAYLTADVRARANLQIITGVQARRVLLEGKRAVEAHADFANSSAEGILIIHDFQRATNLTRSQGIEHLPHNGLRAVAGKAFGQRGVDGGSGRRGSQFGQFLVKQAKVAAVLFGDNSSGIGRQLFTVCVLAAGSAPVG
jgi:choline dehydrogenase-like flavoprotein